MCGILGIINGKVSKKAVSVGLFSKSLDKIKHRGPDDEGYTVFDYFDKDFHHYKGKDSDTQLKFPNISDISEQIPDVIFAHRRLSIIELNISGHQPMELQDRYLITFNGEIYNYQEIKKELESKGLVFKTNTDTEVVLQAYRYYGKNCLDIFIGMFSFVIFDKKNLEVFAARDNFGIKPFYYVLENGSLKFASEIKPLLLLLQDQPTLNYKEAIKYLKYGYIDGGIDTLINQIKELPAGNFLFFNVKEKDIKPVQYWDIIFSAEHQNSNNELYDILKKSVDLHLVSDVSVGACLSGGLDSSLLVSFIVNKIEKLKVFSYLDDDPKISEKKYVEMVLKHLGSSIVDYNISMNPTDISQDLMELIYSQDFPFASLSIYSQKLLFKLAKENNVTVMIDGQGADELFGGYSNFVSSRIADLIASFNISMLLKLRSNVKKSNRVGFNRLFALGMLKFLQNKSKFLERILDKYYTQNWFNKEFIREYDKDLRNYYSSISTSIVKKEMYHALKVTSLPQLLRYEDRNSMFYSIESRVPFCNKNIAQFSFNLNDTMLVNEIGETKFVLKKIAEKSLPKEIVYRKKVGFEASQSEVLRKEWPVIKPIIINYMRESKLFNNSLIGYLENQIFEQKNLNRDVWRLINFILWLKVFEIKH